MHNRLTHIINIVFFYYRILDFERKEGFKGFIIMFIFIFLGTTF